MNTRTRRTLIGVGAALLVGGWGMTQFAVNELASGYYWCHSTRHYFQMAAVVPMALGAGLIGFGAIRTNKETG